MTPAGQARRDGRLWIVVAVPAGLLWAWAAVADHWVAVVPRLVCMTTTLLAVSSYAWARGWDAASGDGGGRSGGGPADE